MKTIIILVSLLTAVSLGAAYTPEQQNTIDGVKLAFSLGQAYQKALNGQNVTEFNALVDQWNAWVVKNFGNDANLLMEKMNASIDLQKPYIATNDTSGKGVVHAIDGVSQYATNDANLLPPTARSKYEASDQGKATGSNFLPGV